MKQLLFLFVIFLSVSCSRETLPDYSSLTTSQCDSLLATSLSVRQRTAILRQAAFTLKDNHIYIVSSTHLAKQKRPRQLIDEAIAIAPADMLCDIKADAIHIYNVQNIEQDSSGRKVINRLISDLENQSLTPDERTRFLAYKAVYYQNIGFLRQALRINEELRHHLNKLDDKQATFAYFIQAARQYKTLKEYHKAIAYCDSAQCISGYVLTAQEQQMINMARSLNCEAIGDYDQAIEGSLKMYPDSNRYNHILVKLYKKAGRYAEGLSYIRRNKTLAINLFQRAQITADEAEMLQISGDTILAEAVRREAIGMAEANASVIRNKSIKENNTILQSRIAYMGGIPARFVPIYSKQAEWEWKRGRHRQALALLEKVQNISNTFPNITIDLYDQLASYYIQADDYQAGLRTHLRKDSIVRIKQEHNRDSLYREIIIAHESELLETTISAQRGQLRAMRQTRTLLSLLVILLITTATFFFLLFRNRQRSLDLLYRRQKEIEQARTAQGSPASTPLTAEERLFHQLEKEMTEKHLFANPDITLDDFSRISGTNRSYASAAINRHAGMNFSQWVNSLRIGYVIAHIHDTDILLLANQAGFASRSSLYRNFKIHTGMTITQYLAYEQQRQKNIHSPNNI